LNSIQPAMEAPMITPTEDDIGRSVLYRTGQGEAKHGFVTSFNADYVFVRYDRSDAPMAMRRADLEWEWP
jgi:hypothetical protein